MKLNKHLGFIAIFLLCSISGFSQTQKSFKKLIENTNFYLEQYSKLTPLETDNFIALDQSGLPNQEIKYIKDHFLEYDGYSKDSISEFNLILEFQSLIFQNITTIIAHQEFEKQKIEELINKNLDLAIVVSDDRKLVNFSLDEKTGGTYQSRISITHYVEDSVPPSIKNKDPHEISNQHAVFEGDGFYEIHSINTEKETKYVLLGFVKGCISCFEFNISLVSLKDGFFEADFLYSINTRNISETEFEYHPASKTISVSYFTDDLTPECICTNDASSNEAQKDFYSNAEEELILGKRCKCTFKFNGQNFELSNSN